MRQPLFLFLLFLVFTSAELTCSKDPNQEGGSLICSFWVMPSERREPFKLKQCVDGFCIEAAVSLHPQPPSMKHNGDLNDDDVIRVGKATYRPPFSQHFESALVKILERTPSSQSGVDWARWCGDLGLEHYDTAQSWYDLELAINAFEESLLSIKRLRESRSLSLLVQGWDEYIASIESNLGESYSKDPNSKHNTEALRHFENARDIFNRLLEKQEASPPPLDTTLSLQQHFARSLSRVGVQLLTMANNFDLSNGGIGGDISSLSETVTKLTDQLHTTDGGFQARALEHFELAIDIYQSQFKKLFPTQDNNDDFIRMCLDYSTTLQYAGTAYSTAGDQQKAESLMLQALNIAMLGDIETPLENMNSNEVWSSSSALDGIAHLLTSLSTVYTQLGRYDEAKLRYRQAMALYQNYNIPLPAIPSMGEVGENSYMQGLLDEHFTMLEAYRNGEVYENKKDASIYEQEPQKIQGSYYAYGKDDGYEADLKYNLGTLYLSMGDQGEAISWFEQAIELYNDNSGNSSQRRGQLAAALTNLSLLYFEMERFKDSELTQCEALDIYQAMYGDGVNPFVREMEDHEQQLAEALGQTTNLIPAKTENEGASTGEDSTTIDIESYKQLMKNLTESILDTPNAEEAL
jgi:tetratricopeptide (TPR) repeat protein